MSNKKEKAFNNNALAKSVLKASASCPEIAGIVDGTLTGCCDVITEINETVTALLDYIQTPVTVNHNIIRKLLTVTTPVADAVIPNGATSFNIIPSAINLDTLSADFGKPLDLSQMANTVTDTVGNITPLTGVTSFNSNDDRTSQNVVAVLPVDIVINVTGFVIIEYILP